MLLRFLTTTKTLLFLCNSNRDIVQLTLNVSLSNSIVNKNGCLDISVYLLVFIAVINWVESFPKRALVQALLVPERSEFVCFMDFCQLFFALGFLWISRRTVIILNFETDFRSWLFLGGLIIVLRNWSCSSRFLALINSVRTISLVLLWNVHNQCLS